MQGSCLYSKQTPLFTASLSLRASVYTPTWKGWTQSIEQKKVLRYVINL